MKDQFRNRKLKAKLKKLQKKEEQAEISAAKTRVDAARKLVDPLSALEPFKTYNRNGLNVNISCHSVKNLSEETLQWGFDLTKTNMQTLYEMSNWGWKDDEKREEMTEDGAMYLIVNSSSDNRPVAFVHFRYDIDYDVDVLYCYEIQLVTEVQRKGLGKFLMQILELLAFQSQMKKVVLTVLHKNDVAYSFYYQTLKYTLDESSPDDEDYVILSKAVKQRHS